MGRAHHGLFAGPSRPGSPFDSLVEILGRKEIVAPFLANRVAVPSPAEALVDVVDIAKRARMAAPDCEVKAPPVGELFANSALAPRCKPGLPDQWRRNSVSPAGHAGRKLDLNSRRSFQPGFRERGRHGEVLLGPEYI